MSQHAWTNFWSKIDSIYIDVKLEVFKRENRRLLPGSKCYTERIRFQLIHAIEESAGCCRRKLQLKSKFHHHTVHNDVQGFGRTTEACSQSGWDCRLAKQNIFCDCCDKMWKWERGREREREGELTYSSPNISMKKRGVKVSKKCLCEL